MCYLFFSWVVGILKNVKMVEMVMTEEYKFMASRINNFCL